MKKTLLTLAIVLAGFSTVNAQKGFYVSLAGGPTYKAGTKVLSPASGLTGSYGEGIQGQLRGGYFFNDKFGVDLGVGYLHGDKQQIIEGSTSLTGAARAFGLSLTGVYNLSENVYVRAGLLTKLGGKTLVEGNVNTVIPTAQGPAPLAVNVTRDNQGSFPLGFTGAFGVKYKIADNWGIFAEMDYQGINVPAEKSLLGDFSATLNGANADKATLQANVSGILNQLISLGVPASDPRVANLNTLSNLISDEFTFVDNPTLGKPEAPSRDVPYSSFGFSFGFTYFF